MGDTIPKQWYILLNRAKNDHSPIPHQKVPIWYFKVLFCKIMFNGGGGGWGGGGT